CNTDLPATDDTVRIRVCTHRRQFGSVISPWTSWVSGVAELAFWDGYQAAQQVRRVEREENHERDDHDQYQQTPETFSALQSASDQCDQGDSDRRPGASCWCVRRGRYVHRVCSDLLGGAGARLVV